MDPHLCVGVDVGCRSHRVGIAHPEGSILEEFDISHTFAGFQEIDGAEIDGVRVSVNKGPSDDKGRLELSGTMKQFRLGRRESWYLLVVGE